VFKLIKLQGLIIGCGEPVPARWSGRWTHVVSNIATGHYKMQRRVNTGHSSTASVTTDVDL